MMRKIDCHVHLVGDGSAGSGCWFRLDSAFRRMQARVMLREAGVSPDALKGQLDEAMVACLISQVRESSLDAVVLLAQDIPYSDEGEGLPEQGGFYVPNDYLFEVVEREPELFIPAVSIHPGRKDAMEELETCIERGAKVLKLLPNCLNVDCSNRRYTRFWERMAEAGIILLAHTGGEFTLPVLRPEFADPRCLTLPLECGVTVIAAHCAGRSGLIDPDYTDDLLKMFGEYPNLYGDNSALSSLNRSRTIPKIVKPEYASRILHGSDFPVPILGLGALLTGVLSRKDYRRCKKIKNVFERDYELKRAMGFSEESFTRLSQLLVELG